MRSDIQRCAEWKSTHDRPIYTLDDTCPDCGATTENVTPPPFDPEDTHGQYRRALKERVRE